MRDRGQDIPATGLRREEALDATIDWYRTNEWWWRPLKDTGASQRRGQAAR